MRQLEALTLEEKSRIDSDSSSFDLSLCVIFFRPIFLFTSCFPSGNFTGSRHHGYQEVGVLQYFLPWVPFLRFSPSGFHFLSFSFFAFRVICTTWTRFSFFFLFLFMFWRGQRVQFRFDTILFRSFSSATCFYANLAGCSGREWK